MTAQAGVTGRLEARLLDGHTGRETYGRVYVEDEAGRLHFPPGDECVAFHYDDFAGREEHFVANGRFALDLPPGRYSVTVERGPEYLIAAETVEIEGGRARHVELSPVRWTNMNARGWYSGDLHVHRAPEEMPSLVLAEDLNLGTDITTHNDPAVGATGPPPGNWLVEIDALHVYSQCDQELERLFEGSGAVLALGLPQPVAFECDDHYPPDAVFCDRAHALGAHVDSEKPFWRNTPVLAALGKLDSLGVVGNHFGRRSTYTEAEAWGAMERDPDATSAQGFARWHMTLYYRLLNCGLRLPATGGTASGLMPNPVGTNRTYVRLDEPFSYAAWFRALRRGRSFATNGPLVFLAAGEAQAGDTIAPGPGKKVPVRLEVESAEPLERAEIVYNGEIVAEVSAGPEQKALMLKHEMACERGGWIAGRAFGRSTGGVRFAQTSPIYVVGDRPPAQQPGDARRLAGQVRRLIEQAQTPGRFREPAHQAETLQLYRQALAVYEALALIPNP